MKTTTYIIMGSVAAVWLLCLGGIVYTGQYANPKPESEIQKAEIPEAATVIGGGEKTSIDTERFSAIAIAAAPYFNDQLSAVIEMRGDATTPRVETSDTWAANATMFVVEDGTLKVRLDGHGVIEGRATVPDYIKVEEDAREAVKIVIPAGMKIDRIDVARVELTISNLRSDELTLSISNSMPDMKECIIGNLKIEQK